MSDWSMYELEDIVWDEFGESGDHIVPHPSGEQGRERDARGDYHKKPRREAVTSVRKSPGSKSTPKDAVRGKQETSLPCLNHNKAPMLENDSWSRLTDDVFTEISDADCIKEDKGSASSDANISDNCFRNSKIDSVADELCENDAILGNGDNAIGGNLCSFPLDDISPTESDLGFFGSASEDKESSDLLYYGWPDIGNFEDVDRMFRSCDATFGQGTASNDQELSWLSAHALNEPEDAKPAYKSSTSESSALHSTLKHCETDMKSLPETIPPSIIDSEKKNLPHDCMNTQMLDVNESADMGQAYENWSSADREDMRERLPKKQARELNEEVGLVVNQSRNENYGMNNSGGRQSKHRSQLGGKTSQLSQYPSGDSIRDQHIILQSTELFSSVPSAPQVFPSPSTARLEKSSGSNAFGYPHYPPYVNAEYDYPPVTLSTSRIKSGNNCHPSLSSKASSYASNQAMPMMPLDLSPNGPPMSEEKIKSHFRQQQTQVTVRNDPQQEGLVGRAAYTDQVPVHKQLHQCQDEAQDHAEVERAGIKFPIEVESSTVPEGSCVSSALSEDISLEASFRQFQYVMEQLDVTTKLCIRDSLYRLARDAAQRCNSGKPNNGGRDYKDKSRLLTPGESDRYTGFGDIETDTNPIDRSIACLLFDRPSDPSRRPPNDDLYLIHRSISCQPLMHEKVVVQGETSGCDSKLLAAEQP